MGKVDSYRAALRKRTDWEAFLLAESGLPGPRGNLELIQAVAEEGDESWFRHCLAYDAVTAPEGTAHEFLPVCGVVGLGRLLAGGRSDLLAELRHYAADPRWRMREGVAMALQRLGDADMDSLIAGMHEWSAGSYLEQRAAAAALCEPRLLASPRHAAQVLEILDRITATVSQAGERHGEDFIVLGKL